MSVRILWRSLLVLGAVAFLYLILWELPQWQVPIPEVTEFDDRIKLIELRNKVRGTLAQIIGGFGILSPSTKTLSTITVFTPGS